MAASEVLRTPFQNLWIIFMPMMIFYSDDFLLGGEEHSNVIANKNDRRVIKATLHKKWSFP